MRQETIQVMVNAPGDWLAWPWFAITGVIALLTIMRLFARRRSPFGKSY